MATTNRTTRRGRRIDDLAAEVDRCLAELRGSRLMKARRRVLQERIAALGAEMRNNL